MTADANGWADCPEAEREALEQWEYAAACVDKLVAHLAAAKAERLRRRV